MNEEKKLDLMTAINHLEDVKKSLLEIDYTQLSQDESNQLAEQIHQCGININKLRKIDLESLVVSFEKVESELTDATQNMSNDLNKIQKAADKVKMIAAAMDTITRIIKPIS
jgi:DNA repair ATPase RecN